MAFQFGLTIVYSHVHVHMQWGLSYCWYLFPSRIRVTSVYNIFTQVPWTNPPLSVPPQNLKNFHRLSFPFWFLGGFHSGPKYRAASGRVISSSHLMTWVTGFQSPPGWHYLFCKGIPINYKPLFATATGLGGDPIDDCLSQFEAVHLSLQKPMEELNMEQWIFRNQRWQWSKKCCTYMYMFSSYCISSSQKLVQEYNFPTGWTSAYALPSDC